MEQPEPIFMRVSKRLFWLKNNPSQTYRQETVGDATADAEMEPALGGSET